MQILGPLEFSRRWEQIHLLLSKSECGYWWVSRRFICVCMWGWSSVCCYLNMGCHFPPAQRRVSESPASDTICFFPQSGAHVRSGSITSTAIDHVGTDIEKRCWNIWAITTCMICLMCEYIRRSRSSLKLAGAQSIWWTCVCTLSEMLSTPVFIQCAALDVFRSFP